MEYTDDIKSFFVLIQKGHEFESIHHNLRKACEFYREARSCLTRLYGEGNKLRNIVNLFDYIWEENREDYRAAVLKLAEAGELLEGFSEQDIIDEFTSWINENQEILLNEAVARTFDMLRYFDFEFSLEDILLQIALTGNDMEEVINRTLVDVLGLPRKFHYLVRQMCKDVENISPDGKYKMLELYDFIRKQKGKDYSNINNEEKIQLANSLYDLLQEGVYKNEGLGAGITSLLDSSRRRINFDMVKGMMKLGDIETAGVAFSELIGEYDLYDIDSKIKIKLLECLLEKKKGNKVKAGVILDEIIQMENDLILQVFFMKEEKRKIEFLSEIDYIMKRITEISNQIKGAQDTYSLVVRTRTLSFDHANIHLSGAEHRNIVLKKQQLDLREKRGEDVTAEYRKLLEHFGKISYGIFEFDSTEICRKLVDKQAILEFTVMADEKDVDFYCVFAVTFRKVTVINLGECKEIDKCIKQIIKYMENYGISKYSVQHIRMLSEYHELYEKVSLPIGKVLPQSIHDLFIAGAGKLLELPFGLLPCFHWYDKFLEDEYQICYINSGKELLRESDLNINNGAVVVGNPDFGGRYPALMSSEKEVETVAKLLGVEPITGRKAVSKCLEEQAGIFHIATHSFLAEEVDEEKDIDPMEKTGLVFAGGQTMTAKEISQLDMSKTYLVVLSTCGIKESKGIYSDLGSGIRRAFVNAGVRYIILNLWKTDDTAAELMMKCFYSCFIEGKKTIEESLRYAKHYLRTRSVGAIKRGKYYDESMENIFLLMKEEDIPYAHPYYWAGFIVFGA